MACDGTIHFAVQEFLNTRTNLAVGSAPRTWETTERAKSRSTRGEPDARSLLSKKNGPPGCTVRLTVNLHVSGSACDVSARMVVVESTGRTSDIFHNPGCTAFTEGPQVLERVDPRAVTVVPADGDGVVAHAGDRAGGYVRSDTLWIQERAPAHLFDTDRASARQSEVPDVEVVPLAVLPEHGQRASVAQAEANRRRSRARFSDGTLDPARLALAGFPGPRERLQPRGWKSLEAASHFRGDCQVSHSSQ